MVSLFGQNSKQKYSHLHYLLLLASYKYYENKMILLYILGLNKHELIVFVFPLNVLFNTGSENIVWGRILLLILRVVFIFKNFKIILKFIKK
jgi:hypothetical protein